MLAASDIGTDDTACHGAATTTRDVQRCSAAQGSANPAYWDVSYEFRGLQHRVQLNAAPGRTVTVNQQGEPRA